MKKKLQSLEPAKKQEGFDGQRTCILPTERLNFCAKHVLCKNLYITDIGYYPQAAFHNRERTNGCAQYILIHCVKGKGWYQINNRKYQVKANQFFIIPADSRHQYGADLDTPWTIYWIHFTGQLGAFYFKLLSNPNTNRPVDAIVNTSRQMLFYDIIQHLELMNNPENIVYSSSCLYAYLSSFQISEIKISINENDTIQQSITFMKENLHRPLRLNDLSSYVNVSSSHLSALFRQRMKYSPMNLFTSFKIQKACQMLMETSQSVKTIAYNLGYHDQYHFSRVFKEVMDVSPKKFKTLQK